jgi:hypothetical protein
MTSIKHVPETGLAALRGTMRDFYVAETAILDTYHERIELAVSGATCSTAGGHAHV